MYTVVAYFKIGRFHVFPVWKQRITVDDERFINGLLKG
jgi:hypothetical protein